MEWQEMTEDQYQRFIVLITGVVFAMLFLFILGVGP
jgi:hypothetical protein